MKLNHINLLVTNVTEGIEFFKTFFNFQCIAVKGNNIIAVLKGTDDFTLVIMQSNKETELAYPDAFHIGFMFENPEKVNELYLKLKNSDIAVGQEPKKIRDSFGFYFHYDKIMIEVGHYAD